MQRAIETGDLFFLYTPRPGVSEVHGPPDVYEFAFILSPDDDHPRRLLVVREKHLPSITGPAVASGQEATADVVEVRERPEELVVVLEERAFRAAGVPRRTLHARPCGEARYVLALHDDHTHLSYALELPETPGQVQRDLGLVSDASYLIFARGLTRSAAPPSALVRTRDFIPVTDVGILEREGNEVLLQPAVEPDAPKATREAEGLATAEIFGELKLTRGQHPTEPLLTGSWR